ncbi:NnrS family protein [Profundibacter amoris]|uniref:NnrS family protein n=1 Tax=Profundibacter amoris TaxID=2171755 RepID=A0A347UJJ9_9RHOB|nr:NnrS family protein [Profundibacter amoris]AXX99027.1 NnrS family protein [Profundibacter amoris]
MQPPLLKQHGGKRERAWQGHPFFSGGFRPFFLFASLFGIFAIALWLLELMGYDAINTRLAPVEWHKHEMLFGYTSAVIAGFLFTAVPNWTGRLPVVGYRLMAIFALWLAGRAAMLLGESVPYAVTATIEAAFLPVLGAVIAREIISGQNWRNIKVLVPVLGLGLTNIWFHIDVATGGTGAAPVRMGFTAILILLMLIGGRIVPSFTRNWLARQEPGKMPVPFNRFDAGVIAGSAVALLLWVVLEQPFLGPLFAILGILHIVRLWRWAGLRTLSNPLLLVLHIFYAFIPTGFLTLAVGMWFDLPQVNVAALHVFGIGAVGGMTIAVMVRASLGHTGRTLASSGILNLAMAMVGISMALRVTGAIWPEYDWAITGSALAWIVAFGLFAFKVGPWLLVPRAKRG